jgi:hypothetical protein
MSSDNSCKSCEYKKKKEYMKNNIEHFSYETPKNMCHYACSSINTTNLLLFVLVLILLYLLSRENFKFNIFSKNKN